MFYETDNISKIWLIMLYLWIYFIVTKHPTHVIKLKSEKFETFFCFVLHFPHEMSLPVLCGKRLFTHHKSLRVYNFTFVVLNFFSRIVSFFASNSCSVENLCFVRSNPNNLTRWPPDNLWLLLHCMVLKVKLSCCFHASLVRQPFFWM